MGSQNNQKSNSMQSHPYDDPSCLKRTFHILTHGWMFPLIKLGYNQNLQPSDCFKVPTNDQSESLMQDFQKHAKLQKSRNIPYNTFSILWQIEKFGIIKRFTLMSCVKSAQLVVPFLISRLTKFFQDKSQPFTVGIFLCFMLFLSGILNVIGYNISFVDASRSVSRIRSYLILLIYGKSFKMPLSATTSNSKEKSSSSSSTGQKITMISSDTNNIAMCIGWVPVMLSNLVLMIIAVIFLYLEVGFAAFAGWCVILIIGGPLQYIVGNKMLNATRKYLSASDKRVKFIGELIKGIRITKMYCWENPLMDQVGIYRSEEMKRLLIRCKYMALSSMLNIVTPQLMTLVLFLVYIAMGNKLTLSKVFTVISLIQLLKIAIKLVPWGTRLSIGCYVGCKRLDAFFACDEREKVKNDAQKQQQHVVCMEHAGFRWDGRDKEAIVDNKDEIVLNIVDGDDGFILDDISLKIDKGKLIALVGSVGSGKSSLIAAIMNEMKMTNGNIHVQDENGIGFVAQEAFIINATVRDNILFGLEYEDKYYQQVLRSSALLDDIEIFPNGDMTEIGGRGVNLSGGQKSRISFARTLYRALMVDIELFLLDDPLSAVDVNVGRIMFHDGICGVLNGKTRVIVMNSHLDLLNDFDEIIVMDNGRILIHDSVDKVINDGDYAHLLPCDEQKEHNSDDSIILKQQRQNHAQSQQKLKHQVKQLVNHDANKGKLTVAEQKDQGSIPWSIYSQYFSHAANEFDYHEIKDNEIKSKTSVFGVTVIILEILLLFMAQSFSTTSDVWLSFYSEENTKQRYPNKTDEWWLSVWSIFVLCLGICSFAASYLFGYLSTRSSMNVHKQTLYSVLRAPMLYFDSIPNGRILNRFSKDTNEMDDRLQTNFNNCAQNVLQIIGYLFIIIYSVPHILIIFLFVIPTMYFLQKYYRRTARSLKRLDQISFSPLTISFNETLLGLDTIRAYKLSEHFMKKFQRNLSENHKIFLTELLSGRWFAAYMDLTVIILLLCVSSLSCYLSRYGDSNIFHTSLLSLSIIYSYSLTSMVQWTIRTTIEVEKNFTAVQRLLHYQDNIESEASVHNIDYKPNKSWPSNGKLEIKNLRMRYRDDLDLVLNGINLSIKAGEKIGICGRTGSGKSSLFLSLFRLVEPERDQSEIIIDGVNCLKLGLKDLRSNLSIIPQDPVLFSGTLRFNLDPFNDYDDDRIYDVLKKIELYDFVKKKQDGLDYIVAENGSNFSKGQKQLICIGRALLKNAKILCLDEATSSIDKYTDGLIQELIEKEFVDKTVLCIAHRLETIMNYDRIVVLEKGKIKDIGEPNHIFDTERDVFM